MCFFNLLIMDAIFYLQISCLLLGSTFLLEDYSSVKEKQTH